LPFAFVACWIPPMSRQRRSHPLRAAFLAAGSLAIGLWSSSQQGREADLDSFRAVNSSHDPQRDKVYAGLTELGSIWASIGAASAIAISGRSRTATRALAAAGATWALGQLLKKAFMRPRPYDALEDSRLLIGKPSGTSWPSSHPAVLLTFVTVVSRDLGLSKAARAGLMALAGSVGVSRTYLGVHYPSDVAGGLLMGRAVGLAWPTGPSE